MTLIGRAENKQNTLWVIINNERKARQATDNQIHIKVDGNIIQNQLGVANSFNLFFYTVTQRTQHKVAQPT